MLQTYREHPAPFWISAPGGREGGKEHSGVAGTHRQWGSWFLPFCSKQFILCLHTNAKTFSKTVSQADRLYQSEHSPLPAPQNTRLLRDTRDRQCEDHSAFCSSLTCRNKWLRWIFALNDAGCEFNSFSGVCICFFSGRGIYLQSKLYFFRDLLCPRKQRRKNLR